MGHCGLHSPGIGWVVKGLEQPVAWLCSRVDGWIPFVEHNLSKNKSGNSRNKRGNLRSKRGNSRNGVQCGCWFWSALLRAVCWHWHVAFIPQELYISHVSVDLGCLLSSPPARWRTSTATSRSQRALPDLNRELQIPVGTAGPQPRAPDPSGHCRTSTTSSRSQWALPDLNRDFQIAVGSGTSTATSRSQWALPGLRKDVR